MLLMVVAPLISRALAHPVPAALQTPHPMAVHHASSGPVTPAAHPMHHGMAHDGTAHGMDHHAEAATSKAATTPASPDPHAEHDLGVDCDYCLIAARMISLLVALLFWIALWPAILRALAGRVVARRAPPTGTLGARGPPAALGC